MKRLGNDPSVANTNRVAFWVPLICLAVAAAAPPLWAQPATSSYGYNYGIEVEFAEGCTVEFVPEAGACDECAGKVTELTLEYLGDVVDAHVEVIQKKDHIVVFDAVVQPGETFSFVGQDHGTLGTEITINVDGVENTKIHTSCSKPIGPGLVSGDFAVVAGSSRNGGALCPLEEDDDGDCGECRGKVTELTLEYLGDVVDAHVEVIQKKDHIVVFDAVVQPGETFSFVGQDHGTLSTEITINVNGVENTKIHTSCSKPIGPGLVSGDFAVVAGSSRDGGALCPVDGSGGTCSVGAEARLEIKKHEVKWEITNTGTETVTIARITLLWPEDNGGLTEIKLEKKKIYDQPLPPATATIDSGWKGGDKDREIKKGKKADLTLKFDNEPVPGRFETDPPLIRILEDGQELADGALFNRPVVPVIEVGDASPVTVTSTLDGAAFSSGDTVAADGSYTLSVEAVDVVGNSAAQTVHFTIDMTPPELTIVTPADGALLPAALVTITGTASDAHLAGVVVGGTAVTVIDGQWSVVLTLAEGPSTLTAVATDQLGQQSSVSIAVDVDTLAPVVTITYPPADFVAGSSTITVIGTVDEAHLASLTVNGVAATVDGGTFTAEIAFIPGANLITATAVDAFDRIGEASVTVMLDTEAPVVAIDQPAPAADACLAAGELYTVGGSYYDLNPGTVELQLIAADGSESTHSGTIAADGRSWSVAGVDLGAVDGTATASVVATDTLANTARSARSWRIDATVPTIGITVDGEGFPADGSAVFNRAIEPRVTVSDGALGAPDAVLTLDGAPYVEGTAIADEGSHQLAAAATDCAGHQASAQVAFAIDLTAPVLTATDPADATLVTEVATYSGTFTGELTGVTLNGLPATVTGTSFSLSPYPWVEGLNTVEIVLVDAAGNRSIVERTFTVDSSGPTIEILENGTAIADGTVYTRPITPELISTDPEATITATLNGAAFTSGTLLDQTGDYTLEATATDVLGRTAGAVLSFRIDVDDGPAITITAPEDGISLPEPSVAVSGTATGNGIAVTVNGVAATLSGGSWSVASLELEADAFNDITAIARDQAGRTARDTVSVLVETGGPRIQILEPAEGTMTNRAVIDVVGAVIGGRDVTADGTVTVAGSPVTLDASGGFRAFDVPLVNGSNTITVTAEDHHQRTGQAAVTVVTDIAAPAIAITADGQPLAEGASFGRAITLRVEVTDAGPGDPPPVVRLNGELQEAAGSGVEIAVAADGGYLVAVSADDAAGNQSRIERSFIIDLAGCTLTDLEPVTGSAVAANAVSIRGRSGTAAGVSVQVAGSGPGAPQVFAAQLADGTFLAGDVPLAVGVNTLEIVCTDRGGETHTETLTIERLAGDGPAVTITSPSAGAWLAGDVVTVSGTVSDPSATVTVNRIAAPVTVPAGGGTPTWSIAVPLVEGPNVLAARAVDGVGRSGKARRVIWRDGQAPRLRITAPHNQSWLGPVAGGLATVDVTGVVDLDVEPNLVRILATTTQGTVEATVHPATGAFIAPAVPLDAGVAAGEAQTLTVTATDSLGHSAEIEIEVYFDPEGPGILLTAPADLTRYTSASPPAIAINGQAWAHEGAQISINGGTLDPATLTWQAPGADGRRSTTFSASIALPDDEGAFGIVAQVNELDDRHAVARRLLVKDDTAPEVVEILPADGAEQVDSNALVLVLFSESILHSTLSAAGGLTLERLSTGESVVGQIAVAGSAAAFVPGSELAAGESYRFRVGAGITDVTGHALTAPEAVTFTVAEATAGVAPVVDALPSAVVCEPPEVTITGSAAPGAALRVRDGNLVFSGIADVAGAFAITVPLSANGYHLLHVYAVDRDGTTGAETIVQVRKDCSGPTVVHTVFDRDTATIAVTFSEAIDPASVTIGDPASALRLFDAQDPDEIDRTGSLSFPADGTVVEILLDTAADAWWRDRPVRLLVASPLAELQGNAMVAPYATVFFPSGAGDLSGGFLFGEAYNDASGRPIEGAWVRLFPSSAALPGTVPAGFVGLPVSEATTDGRGRFTMAGEVAAGRYVVVYEAEGHTRVVRRLALEPATGAVPFDSRLTPLAPSSGSLDPLAGGTFARVESPYEVEIDAAAVTAGEALEVFLTPLGGQGLPDLLPLGWTPLAAAELRLVGTGGALPEGGATPFAAGGVRMSLPLPAWVEAGDELVAVRYDLATGVWIRLPGAERLAGPTGEELLRVPLVGPGTVAVVLADEDPATRPPLPEAGAVLAGVDPPEAFPTLAAVLTVEPKVIAPTGKAVAWVVARSADGAMAWPSGLAVQAYIEEKLVLAGNAGQLLEAPFSADLVLYHPRLSAEEIGTSLPGSVGAMEFRVSPSARAAEVLLEIGYESIRLYPFPEQVERGRLLGPAGGSVASADGVEIFLPEGALGEKTVVSTELLTAEDLAALPPVDGFDTLAGVRVELSGHTLARPATIKLNAPASTPAAIPGDPRLVLAERIEAPVDGRGAYARPVARMVRIAPAGGLPERLAAVPESADSGLPLAGVVHEGLTLVLRAHNPIGFATGYVRATNGVVVDGSRVTADGLGTADISEDGGRYATVAPAGAGGLLEALDPVRDERGAATIPSLGAGEVLAIDITVAPVPPAILSLSPVDGAVDQPVGTTVSVLMSEPLEPASVSASTLHLELANARGGSTGVTIAGEVTLSADGRTVVFESELPLLPGRTYLARFTGGVRDAGGVWYAGGAVDWSFSTSTVLVPGGWIHPEKFYIRLPVDGVAEIAGAAAAGTEPGALPVGAGWSVSPWVEGPVADPQRDTFDAPGDGSFSGFVGHPPEFPVTLESTVWVTVIDPNGQVAGEFRFGPFTNEDGTAFVAPAGEAIEFTTAEGIVVQVPEGAFDEPTVVTVTELDAASLVLDETPEGLSLGAYIDVDFEGEANQSLRFKIPVPAGIDPDPDARVFIGEPVDLPELGRRLRFLGVGGVLEEGGELFFSNGLQFLPEPPPATKRLRKDDGQGYVPPENCQEVREVRDEGVPNCFLTSVMVELNRRRSAAWFFEDGVEYTILTGGKAQILLDWGRMDEFYYNAMASAMVYLPPSHDWNGLYVLPVPVDQPLQIVQRDLSTGWVTAEETYDPIPGGGNAFAEVGLLEGEKLPRPMLRAARPCHFIRFQTPPAGVKVPLRHEIEAEGKENGNVILRSVPDFRLPAGATVELFDLGPTLQEDPILVDQNPRLGNYVEVKDGVDWQLGPVFDRSAHLLAVVCPGDLDPYTFETFELQFDQPLEIEDLDAVAKLWDKGTDGSASSPVTIEVKLDSSKSRLIIRPQGRLPAGHRFVLELDPSLILNRNGEAYWGTAPRTFRFATRKIKGTPIATGPAANPNDPDPPDSVDTLQFGNLLVVATNERQLKAYDVSDHSEEGFKLQASLVGGQPALRALATDSHNRLFFAARLGGAWGVKTVRVEDIREPADGNVYDPPLGPVFSPVDGGIKIGHAAGAHNPLAPSEWLAFGALPQGTPATMEVLVLDEIDETLELAKFYEHYTGGTFADLEPDAEGIYTFQITLESSYQRGVGTDLRDTVYSGADDEAVCDDEDPWDRYQRVSVDNLTTGQIWSRDLHNPWTAGGGGDGTGTLTIRARRGDELRVRYNLRSLGYVAYLGSGITLVDLNRGYRLHRSSFSASGRQCGRRLGKYEGQWIEWLYCSTRSDQIPDGLAWTPDLAVHSETACETGENNQRKCRGQERIDIYSPLRYVGPIHTSSPITEPGNIEAQAQVGCLKHILVPGTDEEGNPVVRTKKVQLSSVALANEATWTDQKIRGLRGPNDALGHTFQPTEAPEGLKPEEVEGDLLFVSLGWAGIFVFDVSDREIKVGQGHTPATTLIGHLYTDGHAAFRLQVDEDRRMLFAGGFDEDFNPIVDVWDIRGVNGAPGTHHEPRPVTTVKNVPWHGKHLGVNSATGLIYTYDTGEGVAAVPYTPSKFTFHGLYLEGDRDDATQPAAAKPPVDQPTARFIPLGVPIEKTLETEKKNRWLNERRATAAFKVRLALPGSFGNELKAKVQSLRVLPDDRFLAEKDLGPAVAMPGGPGWPDHEVVVTLKRIGVGSDDAGASPEVVRGEGGKFSTAYNLYESQEVLLVMADPRAGKDYQLQGEDDAAADEDSPHEFAQCRRCDWPSYLPDPDGSQPGETQFIDPDDVEELLAGGRYLRVFLYAEPGDASAAATKTRAAITFFAGQKQNYLPPFGKAEVAAWADEVPSPTQISLNEPARNPATWSPGEAGVSVSLAAGDLLLNATDFAVPGRVLTVSMDRTYRSAVLGYGPLGSAGWNASFFAHLRYLMTTEEVEYHDGRGHVWRFMPPNEYGKCPDGYEKEKTNDQYCTPEGLLLRLSGSPATGWRLIAPQHGIAVFDSYGRLIELRDRLRKHASDPTRQGNTVRFSYDGYGQLVVITDDYGRPYRLTYDQDPASSTYGLLTKIRDFSGRRVFEYKYRDATEPPSSDSDRRLKRVVMPPVTNPFLAEGRHPNPTLDYTYTDQSFDTAAAVHGSHFSRLRLRGYRLPAYLVGGARPERVAVNYHNSGRVKEVTFPTNVTWTLRDWIPAVSTEPAIVVRLSSPWNQHSVYILDQGRIESLQERDIPTIATGSQGGSPQPVTLTTEYTYHDDGRVETLKHANNTTTTYYYPDKPRSTQTPAKKDRLAKGNVVEIEYSGDPHTVQLKYGSDNLIERVASWNQGWIALRAIPNEKGKTVRAGYPLEDVLHDSDYDRFGRLTQRRAVNGPQPEQINYKYQQQPTNQPGAGYLRETLNREFQWERFGYDPAGNVSLRETSYCTADAMTYDEWDRPIQEITGQTSSGILGSCTAAGGYAAVNVTVERVYDAAGHLVRERYRQRNIGWVDTTYTYNAREQVTHIHRTKLAPEQVGGTQWAQGTEVNTYDTYGRLHFVDSLENVSTTYEYDHGGRVASVTVGKGNPQLRGYDELQRLVYTTDGDQGVWRSGYDHRGRLTQEILPTGVFIERSYIKSIFNPFGSSVVETVYTDTNRSTRLEETRTVLNSMGAVAAARETVLEQGTGGYVVVTKNSYDGSGRLSTVERGRDGSTLRLERTITHDRAGRITTETDAAGNITEHFYPRGGPWPDSIRQRDLLPSGNELKLPTTLRRDAFGRIRSTEAGGTYIYRDLDEQGNILRERRDANYQVDYTYDGRGLKMSAEGPAPGQRIRFGYDRDGRMRFREVARHNGPAETTELTYDAGRLISRQRPGSPLEEFGYYPDDTLEWWKTRLQSKSSTPFTISYVYDAANRLRERNVTQFGSGDLPRGLAPIDGGDAYDYDLLSRPTSIAAQNDPTTEVTYTGYDSRGLPRTERVGLWAGASITRYYDEFGNQTAMSLPQGLGAGSTGPQGFWTGYDALDRPESVYPSTGWLPDLSSPFSTEYRWGGTGRLLGIDTHGVLGVSTSFDYQQVGTRLSSLKVTAAREVVGAFAYEWDAARNLKTSRLADQTGSPRNLAANFGWYWPGHDAAHRLTQAESERRGKAGQPLFKWDFDYGRGHELLLLVDQRSTPETFTSGIEGRILQRQTAQGNISFEYDAEGRRIEDDRFLYTYTWRGDLVQVDVKQSAPHFPGARILYSYDATGRLVERVHWDKVPAGGTDANRKFIEKRRFVWDGATLVTEVGYNEPGQIIWRKHYLPGPSRLDDAPQVLIESYQPQASGHYTYIRDELGSVVAVLEDREPEADDPPRLMARYFYTPYGEAHIEFGPELSRIEFDPAVTEVAGVTQYLPPYGSSVGGALRILTSAPLDPDRFDIGFTFERWNPDSRQWEGADPAGYVIGRDPQDEAQTLVMRRHGWPAEARFRITLLPDLKDTFDRPIQLPKGKQTGVEVVLNVPADAATPPAFTEVYKFRFDNVKAASETFKNTFRGAQTSLFQGLWTDPVSGIAYARARWYDPHHATWLQEDPEGSIDSPNLWAFASWSPDMNIDPFGDISTKSLIHGYAADAFDSDNVLKKGKACALAVVYGLFQVTTVGGVGKIDEAKEALDRFEITPGEYWKRVAVATAQTGANYVGGFAGGVLGAKLTAKITSKVLAGTISGGISGASARFATDVVGITGGTQKGFSSAQEYLASSALGAGTGWLGSMRSLAKTGPGNPWNYFQKATRGQFSSRAAAAAAYRKIRDVYRQAGFSSSRFRQHMEGINFSRSIDVIVLPRGTRVGQWQAAGRPVGSYFAPPGQPPRLGGVNPTGRIYTEYVTTRPTTVLRSSADWVIDSWTLRGYNLYVSGGGTQYFTPTPSNFAPVP